MDTRRQPLRLLASLDVLLTEKSVTRAADRLSLSQPAMSAALKQLRELLGDPLLVKQGRDYVLTHRAAQLQPEISAALTQVDQLFARSSAFDPTKVSRQFRLDMSDAAGVHLAPTLVARMARWAPRISLRIGAAQIQVPVETLARGDLEMVVGHYSDLPPDLRTATLYSSPLVAVTRATHPATASGMTLKVFLRLPHVTIVPHAIEVAEGLREVFERERRPIQLLAAVQNASVAAAVVAASDAVVLLSQHAAEAHAKAHGLCVHALPPEIVLPSIKVRMVWHERSHDDPGCRWLREQLAAAARQGEVI